MLCVFLTDKYEGGRLWILTCCHIKCLQIHPYPCECVCSKVNIHVNVWFVIQPSQMDTERSCQLTRKYHLINSLKTQYELCKIPPPASKTNWMMDLCTKSKWISLILSIDCPSGKLDSYFFAISSISRPQKLATNLWLGLGFYYPGL